MISHSHQDAGWVSKVDEYYNSKVKHIFASTIPALENNPNRTFTHADIYYFQRWYRVQS